ncbi:MAG: hypothetical protein J7M19_07480 [Planctomycetes bacterium]|nr:hypothetical protein [Planctomycetota bacterium]
MRKIIAVLVVLVFSSPLIAQSVGPPPSASVAGVTNAGWEVGMCHEASFGQLVQQKDPAVTPADIIARTGESTQACWMRGFGGYTLFTHPRWIDAGALVEAARLSGVGIHVGYGRGHGRGPAEKKAADTVTMFKSEAQAVLHLKEVIAGGAPVQVHTDMYYLDPASYDHCNHRIVVHGYDADNIYYTDNGGDDGTKENIALPWADFLDAWSKTPLLNPRFPAAPYIMIYLANDPSLSDDDWTLCWLALDAFNSTPRKLTGPDAIRAAAEALRDGGDPDVVLNIDMCSTFAHLRPYFTDYLTQTGYLALAAEWQNSCDLWNEMAFNPLFDWNTAPDVLDSIADIEEDVLTQLAALAAGVDPICVMTPDDGDNLSSPGTNIFRWAALPEVKKTVLQLAMTGDFADRHNVKKFIPKPRKFFVTMTERKWLTVLRKDGGDRQLTWRVTGLGRQSDMTSAERTLTWDLQQITQVAPTDGYLFAEDELVTFTFVAPDIAKRPKVIISTTGNFTDRTHRKYRIVLTPKRNESQVSFRTNTLKILRRKDNGDNLAYWRVEDAASRLTTVEPSLVRQLNMP